jgi:hypothetical protein
MDINKINNYLKKKGLSSKIDEDGDILFRHKNVNYFIEVSDNFVRIGLPNFWPIDNDFENDLAIKLASESTKHIKCAKILVVNNDVWGTAEFFIANEDHFGSVFMFYIDAIKSAVSYFIERMRKQSVK